MNKFLYIVFSCIVSTTATINAMSPLHKAASAGNVTEVERLLSDHDVNVNQKDNLGKAPLHSAAIKGHVAVAKLLLKHNATVDLIDINLRTPLHWAALLGQKEVISLFLNHSPDIDIKDIGGMTPLDWAAANGHKDIVRLLLNHYDHINQKTAAILTTALDWAKNKNHKATVVLCEKWPTIKKYADEVKLTFCAALLTRIGINSPVHAIDQYCLQNILMRLSTSDFEKNIEQPINLADLFDAPREIEFY